jgi:hypothetical protein
MGREEEIRIIAYRIWEEESCCHGRDVEHWLKAEAIWEEKQKKESVSTDIKAASKHVTKRGKKNRPVSKKH